MHCFYKESFQQISEISKQILENESFSGSIELSVQTTAITREHREGEQTNLCAHYSRFSDRVNVTLIDQILSEINIRKGETDVSEAGLNWKG